MLDFEFTDEQELMRESAREFAEAEVRPRLLEIDEDDKYPLDLAKRCVELGFRGVGYPEELGGMGGGVVDRTMPGFEQGEVLHKYWWRGSGTGEIYLNDVRVSQDHMIGEVNRGLKIVYGVLDKSRLMCATTALGLAEGAFEQAVAYGKERQQFGRPITSFQAISHMIADMRVQIEAARHLVYHAAALCDAGKPFSLESSYAKLFTTEMAKKVCDDAMQICGGMGLDKHFGIDRYYRDARTMSISEGSSQIQRHIISKAILRG